MTDVGHSVLRACLGPSGTTDQNQVTWLHPLLSLLKSLVCQLWSSGSAQSVPSAAGSSLLPDPVGAAAALLASACPHTHTLILSLLPCSLREFGKAPVLSLNSAWSPGPKVASVEPRASQNPTSIQAPQLQVLSLFPNWSKLMLQARQVLDDTLSFLCTIF